MRALGMTDARTKRTQCLIYALLHAHKLVAALMQLPGTAHAASAVMAVLAHFAALARSATYEVHDDDALYDAWRTRSAAVRAHARSLAH